ncbi:MAG TPA: hypothetical protein VIW29_19555 [Polyangiaceae bacterium]
MGREHDYVTTYFATRILYQRGKLDLQGVIARLSELVGSCGDFPEAQAMLNAAQRGTLRPEPRQFNEATVPPPPHDTLDSETDDEDDDHRPTDPGYVSSSDAPAGPPHPAPPLEARLKTPQAPGIPRAPLVPQFSPREQPPSYAPPPDLELELGATESSPWNDTVSAPPPSSSNASHQHPGSKPPSTLELGPLEAVSSTRPWTRNTAPSPGAPGAPSEPPSVFLIATWLADRDFERALSAVEQLGPELTPELSLLEVRALVGLGRKPAARRALDRLCRAPLLDPDLRAAVARLLIDLGDVGRATTQARRAHAEDPEGELSRLTLAWALARADAWLVSPRIAAELDELLADFEPQASPMPALGFALRGLMLMQSSLEAARQSVDAALAIDGSAHDALAIGALIAHRQGRSADVKRLQARLHEVGHHAADDLATTFAKLAHGVAPPRHVSEPPPSAAEPVRRTARPPFPASVPPPPAGAPAPPIARRASPWEDEERRIASGDGKAARFEFEQGLARRLESLPLRPLPGELSHAAMVTARYLTESGVARHFAPFDLSLFSIARLDAALGLVYRGTVGPRTEMRSRALLGLGAYAGECLRRAYAGEWVGDAADLMHLHIEGQGLCFLPFRDLESKLQAGEPLEVGDTPLPHPGAEPLGQRVSLDVTPPTPWDPALWPAASQLPELGARLGESPVGVYCAVAELPLDLSFASLRSIDRYVTLLAPPLAPPDPEAVWVRRAAVLVGAYLGEVLRATHGGVWETTRGELRAEAYRITLPGGAKALPVAAAIERLSGRRLEQPSDYARRITG